MSDLLTFFSSSCSACLIDIKCGYCESTLTPSYCSPADENGDPSSTICDGNWLHEGGCSDTKTGGK